MNNQLNIERARKIYAARAQGIAEGIGLEQVVAAAILQPRALEHDAAYRHLRHAEVRDISDFKATEHLSTVLDIQFNAKGKFDPKFCSDRDFRQIWLLRQTIDRTGISYGFYVDHALRYLKRTGAKRVHLTMLRRKDVVAQVLKELAGIAT